MWWWRVELVVGVVVEGGVSSGCGGVSSGCGGGGWS